MVDTLVTGTMSGKYWFMYVHVYVFCARKEERNNVITTVRISGSWFRASAMTTMNKKPTRCTIILKSLKPYCILIPLYMFRALLRPSSGAS
jgi:hypothetical protein